MYNVHVHVYVLYVYLYMYVCMCAIEAIHNSFLSFSIKCMFYGARCMCISCT